MISYRCSMSDSEAKQAWARNSVVIRKFLDSEGVCCVVPFTGALWRYERTGSEADWNDFKEEFGFASGVLLLAAESAYRAPSYVSGVNVSSFVRERWFLWASILMSGPIRSRLLKRNISASSDEREEQNERWRRAYLILINLSSDVATLQHKAAASVLCELETYEAIEDYACAND